MNDDDKDVLTAAIAFVSSTGACDDSDEGATYCNNKECVYCDLAFAVDKSCGVELEFGGRHAEVTGYRGGEG